VNKYSKEQSAFIFQIFATFINEISDEQYEAILNGKSKISVISNENATSMPNLKSDSDVNEILNQLKSYDRKKADSILSNDVDKDVCLRISNVLNIKSNSRYKKDTIVKKILDVLFPEDNNYDILINKLKQAQTRQEVNSILVDSKLKISQLKQLAESMNISLVKKTKDGIIQNIVQDVIGNRLDAEAIMNLKLK